MRAKYENEGFSFLKLGRGAGGGGGGVKSLPQKNVYLEKRVFP